jgi:hypothetical protein
MAQNEVSVYFLLSGDFVPDELTERIGFAPTSAWARGSRNPELVIPRTSIWKVSTGKVTGDFIDVETLADGIIDQLEPYREKIKQAIDSLDLYAALQVAIYFTSEDYVPTPAIGFSTRTMAFLVDLGAPIDVDTYVH